MAAGYEKNGKAVVVRALVRRFGSFVAVDGISFEVEQGEIFGFLGPNGAGKSTTIRILCGILAPSSGGGTVAGLDIGAQAELVKAQIGYMSQKFSLYEDLTVEENIDFYSGIYRLAPEKKQERKRWVLEMAGLEQHRSRRTGILSAGWKQRLALGCAILHQPPILFLDEPTSGVDPLSRRRFWDLIYELSGQGITVFITTHYMDEAEHCHRLGLIYRGKLIATGSPDSLKKAQMPEQLLEVVCDRPQDALGEMETLPEIQGAALFGRGLHVVAADAESASSAISRRLTMRGYKIERIEKIAPSLEDVFVSLIRQHDQSEANRETRP
ncbi:MAG: multidrug ABC transporter ATP-binding protein [Acidobacteria bacterium RIFCSPLOWO2_02_FULL_59_13]|nr:MAG: multidrug ABC transporter ATP-binding protein [Acidobacteria bacterium RIFCSPLOWO2_02_FULL_59_13]